MLLPGVHSGFSFFKIRFCRLQFCFFSFGRCGIINYYTVYDSCFLENTLSLLVNIFFAEIKYCLAGALRTCPACKIEYDVEVYESLTARVKCAGKMKNAIYPETERKLMAGD